MTQRMPRRVAIWIDHQTAILAMFVGEHPNAEETLHSNAGPHTHGGGWSQHRFDAHRHEELNHYYDEVIHHLGPVDEILILGPGQAKHELRHRIEHHKGLKGKVMALQDAAKITEAKLVDQAEDFFGLEKGK